SRLPGGRSLGAAERCPLGRCSRRSAVALDLLATAPGVVRRRMSGCNPGCGRGRTRRTGAPQLGPVVRRRDIRSRKKRGDEIGNTKCGKGMKLEVVTDANGIPLGTKVAAANRAETDLIEEALDDIPVPLPELPEGSLPIPMVVDRGYDCDPLRDRLLER